VVDFAFITGVQVVNLPHVSPDPGEVTESRRRMLLSTPWPFLSIVNFRSFVNAPFYTSPHHNPQEAVTKL